MNLDKIMESIAEATAEALRNYDIQKTIEEVRRSPEITKLDNEIKAGRSFLRYLENMGG